MTLLLLGLTILFIIYLLLFNMYMKIYIMYFSLVLMIIWGLMIFLKLNNFSSNYLMNLIMILVLLFFITNSWWKFYMIYECSMLPMVLLIMSWGYNPSRFPSSLYMIMYMIFFSFPSLIIMIMNNCYFLLNLDLINFWMSDLNKFIIMMMLMVKIPVFTLHYWLPKAHGEASTLGSIILASGLLKMGGLGYYKMSKFFVFLKMNMSVMIYLCLMSTLMCLLQNDFKKMIAYMSVSHMTLSLTSLSSYKLLGYNSFLLINMTHILTSALLFYMSGLMFSNVKSRLLFLNNFCLYKNLFVIWIMTLLSNLGIPPFFSVMGELLNFSTIVMKNYLTFFVIMTIMIFSSLYTIFILNSFNLYKVKMLKMLSVKITYVMSLIMLIMWFFI